MFSRGRDLTTVIPVLQNTSRYMSGSGTPMAAPPLCGSCLLSVAEFTTLSGHLMNNGDEGKDRALGIVGCGANDGK